ncbi:MAG: 5'-methylthioadenosine/S-adenosylhomocysteine nucleosidase [Deltaproteobacteria bacterium]|nr:5'-methylthioadenosine/S-adenosylhomocysteine nucleosidase [Deltaproteobacteria bacterium]
MIGIVTAFRHELQPLLARDSWQVEQRGWRRFHRRRLAGVELVATSSGLGKVMAAAATQLLISAYRPSLIINAGSCGGLAAEPGVGALVLASEVIEYDFASHEQEQPHLACDPELVDLVARRVPGLVTGPLASADRNADTPEQRQWLRRTYGALAADWEGAAVVRVAARNRVPALVLRGITDVGDDDLETEFTANVDGVMAALGDVLRQVLAVLAAAGPAVNKRPPGEENRC